MEEERIRLLLLDGQALFRGSLSRLLAAQSGFEVVGECGQAEEALRILAVSRVHMVLLELECATLRGGGFLSRARDAGYDGKFLVVSTVVDPPVAAQAIRLGASGIFLKSEPPERLIQAIQVVANGAVWFDQQTIQMLADRSLLDSEGPRLSAALSERERRVLAGIVGGLTNRKIGDNLGCSEGAVKSAVQQLFHKTGVRTRSQLVRAALEQSMIAPGQSLSHL